MTLDYNLFIVLINFGVNYFVMNCVDCPVLNLVFGDVQVLSKLSVGEVCLLGVQLADLDVRLLDNQLFLGKSFFLHEFLELT